MTLNGLIYAVATGTLLLGTSASSFANDDREEPRVRIQSDMELRDVQLAAIDNERFELGFYTGTLSVEDFGTDLLTGIELSYHLREDWLLQMSYGQSSVGRAAFETSQRRFLSSDDRDFEYFSIAGGYRLISGRSFFGQREKYNSNIYVLAGPERVSFAGSDEWGWNAGLSYRIVFTDWLTSSVDFREHIYERRFIGDSKRTMNTEFRFGINALF